MSGARASAMNKPLQTLVSVRNLSVDFRAGNEVAHAVRRVSFTIGKGETVALVGESGHSGLHALGRQLARAVRGTPTP